MYNYTVDMGTKVVDLDNVLSVIDPDNCSSDSGAVLRREMHYQFGEAGCKFVFDAIKEKIDAIKEQDGGEDATEDTQQQ